MTTALDYAQSRAKREWEQTHSRSPLAWLFRRLGAMRPVSGVWIRQYRDGDWESVRCKGEVIRSWKYDADGLTIVSDVPELDRMSAIASTTPVISFCVDETAGRMIYQEWHGVRAGHGCILARRGNGEWATEKHGWIS
jgi:hypothetical protein